MKIMNRGLLAVLALAAASCASADTIVDYGISGSGTFDGTPGVISGSLVVDQTLGAAQSINFTATGLGALAAGLPSLLPGIITNPSPGEIAVSISGALTSVYTADIEAFLGVSTSPNPLLHNLAGSYTSSINTSVTIPGIGTVPIDVAGTLKLTQMAVPEPNFSWIAGGLLGIGVLFGMKRKLSIDAAR